MPADLNSLYDKLFKFGVIDSRDKLPRNPKGRKFGKRDVTKLKGLVMHQGLSWGDLEDLALYHTGPNHMSSSGLESISYTFGVDFIGQIHLLNDLDVKTWSQGTRSRPGDENAEFVSVVFTGAFKWGSIDNYLGLRLGEPTIAQLEAFKRILNIAASVFEFGADQIYGHKDFGKDSCPGNTLYGLVMAAKSQFNLDDGGDIKRFLRVFGFESIKQFQSSYSELYSPITVDGVWGPQTKKAANNFLIRI